ncbi:phosphotransferase [Flavobacteriaceae bacterium 3-367]|uniref:phosphotransferase family protein n=1 Tax=Eudoraea algarum TaxID=3417568 RepID=UPI0032791B56
MEIPDFLKDFLIKNEFILKEVIQHSKWKKTFVLKIANENDDFILKAVSNISPLRIKSKFITEANVYLKNSNNYVPNLVLSTDAVIITEYIKGKTLREYLNEGENIHEIIESLVLAIQTFYEENKSEHNGAKSFEIAYANISSLAQSGPYQTKTLSLFDKVINKIIAFVLKLKLKKALVNINQNNLKPCFAHGDFHYNNIFVTTNKNIKFIDFENVVYNEYFDFDILYLLTMIEAKVGRAEISRTITNKMMSLINDKEGLKPIYDLYRIAASVNPRFSKDSLKAHQKLLLLVRLIP